MNRLQVTDVTRIKINDSPNQNKWGWFDVEIDNEIIVSGCYLVVTKDKDVFVSFPFKKSKRGTRFSIVKLKGGRPAYDAVSYTHLRAHET